MNKKTLKSLSIQNKKCEECNHSHCYVKHFQRNFKRWTSGNDYIDKFIQNTQLSAHRNVSKVLEWIPYDRFNDVEYIEKIGVYSAFWIDGYIYEWNNNYKYWKRFGQNMCVTLKRLNNPRNITLEFMDKVLFNKILKIIILKIIFANILYL
jgi:hypothetical protein